MYPDDGRYADRPYGRHDDHHSRRAAPFHNDHSFRGAAERRQPQHDSYRRDDRYSGNDYHRDTGYMRRDAPRDYAPPREEFTFRAPSGPRWPAESAISHTPNPPPRRHQGKARGPQRVNGRINPQSNQRGGRRWQVPKPAHKRELLTQAGRETTPERLEGMGGTGDRFAEYISSSDDEGDEPARKRAKVEPSPAVSAPKWSNPDPYTALPPPETLGAPKKDIVQVIRKAKLEQAGESADPAKANLDFISFNFDDDDDGQDQGTREDDDGMSIGSAASVGDAPPPDAPKAPKNMTQFNTSSFTPTNPSKPASVSATMSVRRDASAPRAAGQPSLLFTNPGTLAPPVAQPSLPSAAAAVPSLPARPPPVVQPAISNTAAATPTVPARPVHVDLETGAPILATAPRASKKRKLDQRSIGDISEKWAVTPDRDPTPWFRPANINSASPALRLHNEVHDFFNFVRPHGFEEDVRRDMIRHIQSLVRTSNVSHATSVNLECFGSFAAGLYLPDADLDLVAVSSAFFYDGRPTFCQRANDMRRLGSFLQRGGGIRGLVVIHKARVPIIKFTEQKTGIQVDISFENNSGVIANKTFQDWKQLFPVMPVLVVLIKQLVKMYGLNEVHTGGIGGFTIICLVVSMLQLLPHSQFGHDTSPGELLLHFLDLYGNKFNLRATGINMDPPGYFNKLDDPMPRQNETGLTIRDPNNPANDISGGSKRIGQVFEIFRKAHAQLQRRLAEVQADHSDQGSILGCMLAANYSSYMDQRARLHLQRYNAPLPLDLQLSAVPQPQTRKTAPQDNGPRAPTRPQKADMSSLPSEIAKHGAMQAGPKPVKESNGDQKHRKLAEDFRKEFAHIDLGSRTKLNMFDAGKLLQEYGAGDADRSGLFELISERMDKHQKKLQKHRKPGQKVQQKGSETAPGQSKLTKGEKKRRKAQKKQAKREAQQGKAEKKAHTKDQTAKSAKPKQPAGPQGRKAKKGAQAEMSARVQGTQVQPTPSAVKERPPVRKWTHKTEPSRRSTRLNGSATAA